MCCMYLLKTYFWGQAEWSKQTVQYNATHKHQKITLDCILYCIFSLVEGRDSVCKNGRYCMLVSKLYLCTSMYCKSAAGCKKLTVIAYRYWLTLETTIQLSFLFFCYFGVKKLGCTQRHYGAAYMQIENFFGEIPIRTTNFAKIIRENPQVFINLQKQNGGE